MKKRLITLTICLMFILPGCINSDDNTESIFHGDLISSGKEISDFNLLTSENTSYNFKQNTEGKVTVIAFLFTNCYDICPVVTYNLRYIHESLNESQLEKLEFLTITVDPWRDNTTTLEEWKQLKSDDNAVFDKEITINGNEISPMITWGTSPEDVITIEQKVPNPKNETDEDKKNSIERSLKYMGLKPDMAATDIKIDKVFIGSCTNGRIEDLREAAKILKDKKISSHVQAMVVPGSGLVKEQAEQEGLDKIFIQSGFDWREPGCSMCLAMNADKLKPEERCASTSNRNFEGRQGRGGRTHLVSPGMAAAAAISGNLEDVRKFQD